MRPILNAAKEVMRLGLPRVFHTGALYLQEKLIEFFPHFGTDLLAHSPRVLSSGGHTADYRSPVLRIKGQELRYAVRVFFRFLRELDHQTGQQSLPAAVPRSRRLIEHQIEIEIDQTRGVFRPFQVTAHPVQTFSDS